MGQLINPIGNEWNPPARPIESPAPPPPPEAIFIGWATDVHSPDSTMLAANEGTDDNYLQASFPLVYCGVVGGTDGVVVWTTNFVPSTANPDPVVSELSNGRLEIEFYANDFGGASPAFGAGLMTISATVDGVAAENSLQVSMDAEFYATLAWGQQE